MKFLIPVTLWPKNHNLFANIKKDVTEGRKKRKIRAHSLIIHGGGGPCEEKRGRGWRLLYTQSLHEPGDM